MSDLIERDGIMPMVKTYDYELVDKYNSHDYGMFTGGFEAIVNAQPTVNAIPIPEGATNGDMIKAMFGIEPCEEWECLLHFKFDERFTTSFTKDWWNAPYKGDKG